MSPLRGEEFTGRTVDEAVERGLRVLGRTRTEVGELIGRVSENLVALQQVTSAMAARRVERAVHRPVCVEAYRRRREEQLRDVARRVAVRVGTTGQTVTVEPLLAYERRIVH